MILLYSHLGHRFYTQPPTGSPLCFSRRTCVLFLPISAVLCDKTIKTVCSDRMYIHLGVCRSCKYPDSGVLCCTLLLLHVVNWSHLEKRAFSLCCSLYSVLIRTSDFFITDLSLQSLLNAFCPVLTPFSQIEKTISLT